MRSIIYSILFVLLISNFASAVRLQGNNKGTQFDLSSIANEEMVKNLQKILKSEGVKNNDISTFISILSSQFPMVQNSMDSDFMFGETFEGCFEYFFSQVCWNFSWELYLGWKVRPQAIDLQKLNVTYVPYARLEVGAGANSASNIFKGSLTGSTTMLNLTLPTSFELQFDTKSLCYDSNFITYQPSALVQAKSEVLECYQDLEEGGKTGVWNPVCNYSSPLAITLFNTTEVETTMDNVIERTCWTIQKP